MKAAVLGDAGGDFRMGELHQQRAPAGEQQDHFPINVPDLAVALEKSLAAFCLVRNRAHVENARPKYRTAAAPFVTSSAERCAPGKIHHAKAPNVNAPTPQIR